ncbi:CIR protein [Plasmodium chabaudi chabaudi]|uniref:PIR protein n=1 Tax=Plasmodium chabaudi chabaudi TaxID=31271 RepID=A0A4V0KDE5_PLACU|nr:CIR protein [Plasmodium chabaudi chabaudi]VTZ71365.1 CIR protein [Plasmodium chabaudi chabaudi]|eukprot:XP_016655119.1 CIR protein [Plasmodium chabaudi chabaudi]
MNYSKACDLFFEVDELIDDKSVDVDSFNDLSSYFNEYCPEKNGSKICSTDYERMIAVGAYLFMEFINENNIDLNSDKEYHSEYFIMWISHLLYKMETNNLISLENSYENNLGKSIGDFNFLNLLHNKKYLMNANIVIMNVFYHLFKEICRTIKIYQTENTLSHEYINSATQIYFIYDEISKFVKQCGPYIELMHHIKAIYEEFRQTIKENIEDPHVFSQLMELPSIDKTKSGSEFKSNKCNKVHEKIIKKLPKLIKKEKDKLNGYEDSQEHHDELSTIMELLGSDSDEESGDVELQEENREQKVESKDSHSISQDSAISDKPTTVIQKQHSGNASQGTIIQSGKNSTPSVPTMTQERAKQETVQPQSKTLSSTPAGTNTIPLVGKKESTGEQAEGSKSSIESILHSQDVIPKRPPRRKRSVGSGSSMSISSSGPGVTSDASSSIPGTDVKMDEKPSIWCIGSNKKCDIVGIGIIGISIFIVLAFMYKYLSFGSRNNSKKKKITKKVINLVDGKKMEQTFIKSVDREKKPKIIVNSDDNKKIAKIIINSDDMDEPIKTVINPWNEKRKTHATINSEYKKKYIKSVINSGP